MSRPICKPYPIDPKADVEVIEEITATFTENYEELLNNERSYWVDMPWDFLENMDKDQETPERFKDLNNDHYNFTFSNGATAILLFLTSKFPEN